MARVAFNILHAIIELHKLGLAHRNITTDNIVVQADGTVKLVDFSFAEKLGVGLMMNCLGTPGYAAPEISDLLVQGRANGYYG